MESVWDGGKMRPIEPVPARLGSSSKEDRSARLTRSQQSTVAHLEERTTFAAELATDRLVARPPSSAKPPLTGRAGESHLQGGGDQSNPVLAFGNFQTIAPAFVLVARRAHNRATPQVQVR